VTISAAYSAAQLSVKQRLKMTKRDTSLSSLYTSIGFQS